MRYEDASATDFNAGQALAPSLNANGDVDVILAGQYGPATGNAITGTGTISGIAGADLIGAGASITAIQGAGGSDTTFSGGKLQVAGEHGVLTIDAQGNYSYVRNSGSPNGVSDVFTYTLAGGDGDTDLATLTINIGKTPLVVQANAVQVVPGPDGVVTLPPGVELSDIHVVGRNLVIEMPDGSQMIIVDGAVFVPQLVLGTVEVPSTNLAALLIDSEPTPAAGPPQSSGGNFAVPVAPLDPGAPLGDLIPPTELTYTPPVVEELAQAVEEDDEIVLITDLTPSISGGDVTVDEDDLLSSRGPGESAGSDTSKESLTVSGTFTLIAPDGVDSLTVGSLSVIANGSFQAGATLTTPLGNTLTITGYNAATGVVSYSYTLGDNEAHANAAGENSLFEDFLVTLTDEDGDVDTDTLSVNIIDDVPTANDDVAGLLFGGPISVTVDVDTNDVPGADGTASRIFTSLTGTYGNLVLNPDGTQTYTLSASGIAVMNNLPTGQTLTDTFTYTLTDGDGDSDPANLVVTLTGGDDPVLITNLTPSASGGDAIVDEDDLADGSDTSKESLTVTGNFTISAPDGVDDLTVGGVSVIVNGVFQVGATGLSPLGNQITFTGYNAATGVVSYSYTLLDNEAHPNGNGENSLFDNMTVTLTDNDGDVDTDTLSVQIVDDVPVANNDSFVILEGDADNAITFDVDLNDVPGADGTASRVFTSLTGTYGNLVLNGDDTQTYTLNAVGIAAINALPPGATLADNFSYTLTDGDGDSDPATLVITLTGTDDPPVITNLTPSAQGGDAIVDEDDLADGSDTVKESLTVTGDFTISAPDGVNDLTVGGINVIVDGVFQVGATGLSPLGNTITFTGYNAATGVVSYSYTLLDNEAHANANGQNSLFDDMAVVLTDTDNDIANGTLSVQIVDDVPTANDDAFTIFEGDADNAITFDVDLNDVPGADGTASRIFTSLTGTYGNLVINGDGTQTYTLNAAGVLAINALAPGATLQDNFSYTLTDTDGDADPATLVITLTGTDDPPVITNLTPSASGGDAIVDEDDLADGSDTSKESLTVTGDFTISAPDGVNDLTVGGINVIIDGVFQVGASGATPLGNTITFTGYNAATGVVSYSYTLLDNEAHANANGQNSLFDDMAVVLTDTDNDIANGTLSVQIVDDVPTANDDAFTIFEGDADNAITFDVDLNDVPGADGTASRIFTSLTGTYGNLVVNPDGTQTYTLNAAGVLAINALAPGATLQDNFSYTLTDGDGDADPATLVITLTGTDDPPIITNLNPNTNGGDAIVDEDDLVPDGSDTVKESTTVTGDFTISAADGINDLTVNGINVIIDGVFQVGATGGTPMGNTITFTGYNAATGVVSYSYTLLDNEAHPNANGQNSIYDDMAVVLTDTDNDIANGTLSVQIVDDVPVANDDAFTIFEGDADNAITFDVDLNDVPGADGTASRIFTSLTGTYGNLVVNPDGTQTYTLNAAGVLAINALAPGATLNDNFTYTLTDGDGDSDPATLVITLSGTDDPPVITNLTPSAQGGDAIVDEDDLADGSDTSKESLTVTGDFTITAPDGVNDLTVNGINVIIDGVFQVGATGGTPLGNTITFTGYNAATGVVSYSYTLLDNEAHANANGQNSLFDNMAVVLTDTDNDVANGTLSVQIVDDVPTANDDAFTIFEGDADNAISFDVDLNDVPGADGTASRVFTSLTGTYGNLTLNGDGTQTYTLNAAGVLAINALAPGATLQDNFSYTLTDGDGDADPANLVITLTGTDDPPVITGLNPNTNGGDAIVDEDDLVPDGSDTTKESTTVTGDFTISAPDGVNDLTVNGINVIIDGVFQVGATGGTPLGNTITFTGYNAATGVVSYSYTLLDNETHPNANGQNSIFDDMAVVLTDTDNDVANGTLSVQIVDDVPVANDDAFTILEGDADNAISFDVDLNDVPGADGTASRTFTSLTGTYGNLTLNGDGTQTYTLTAFGIATLNGLSNGATLNDNFSYTLTDGDGDSDPATLVITLQGTDDPVLITNLTPSANGGDVIVDEDDLLASRGVGEFAGSDPIKESTTVNGDFTISAPDGVDDLVVGGFNVIVNGVFQPGSHVTPLGNTLTFISYNAGTGVVSYSYTLNDNETHPAGSGENSIFENFGVTLTDTDGDVDTDTLSVQIVDDIPTLGAVQDQQANNSPAQAPAVGSLHFTPGADGPGSTMTITATNAGITSGGFNLVTNQVGNVLTAYTDNNGNGTYQAGIDVTAVYTITVNPSAGTSGQYVFDLLTPLDPTVTPIAIGQGSSFGAGPSMEIVVTDDATLQDLVMVTAWSATGGFTPAEITAWQGGAEPAWTQESDVNGSTQGWGRGNNNFDANEILRFDFGVRDDYDAVTPPDGPYEPAGGPMVNASYATFSFFNFDAGEQIQFVAHYTNGTSQSFVLNGPSTGLTISAPAGTQLAWIDVFQSIGSMKLNLVEIGVASTNISETINASVQLSDGDGDLTAVDNFTITIGTNLTPNAPNSPFMADDASESSPMSLMASNDDQQQQSQKVAANTNTVVLAAAVAAAGMAAEPAAASDPNVGDETALSHESQPVASSDGAVGSGSATSGSTLVGDSSEAAAEDSSAASSSASSSDDASAGSNSLTAGDGPSADEQPVQLLEGTEAPANVSVESIVSPVVSMPSAEALIAASLEGAAAEGSQSNPVVGKVLVDALESGGADASVDALLAALPAGNGGNAAVEALASQPDAAVSAWDMGPMGGLPANANFTMEALALHHDAVQPVANG